MKTAKTIINDLKTILNSTSDENSITILNNISSYLLSLEANNNTTTLNLDIPNPQYQIIYDYLQDNATEDVINLINNGSPITKNGKELINKKTLTSFIKWASTKAREEVKEKSQSCYVVSDDTILEWSMSYFSDPSIEGELYNLDGTKYIERSKAAVSHPTYTAASKIVEPKKIEQPSLFDMLNDADNIEEEKPKESNIAALPSEKTNDSLSLSDDVIDDLFSEDYEDDDYAM